VPSFYGQKLDVNCYPIFKRKNEQRENFASLLNKRLGKSKRAMKPMDKKKRATKRRLEQMILDVGQKGFGPVTCKVCGMLYTPQSADDAERHVIYHKKFTEGMTFPGWRHERVLREYDDGRVIMVVPSDPKSHQNKAQEMCSLINLELGYPDTKREIDQPTMKTLLFIYDRRVCGGLVAEIVHEAYPLIAADESGSEQQTWFINRSCPQSVMCGVSRLWVCKKYRLRSIATRLMDCLRLDLPSFPFLPSAHFSIIYLTNVRLPMQHFAYLKLKIFI
jgi:hypothetical protein